MLPSAVAAHVVAIPSQSEQVGRHRRLPEPAPRRPDVTDVSVSCYLSRIVSALAVLTLVSVVSAVGTPEVTRPAGPSTAAGVAGQPVR